MVLLFLVNLLLDEFTIRFICNSSKLKTKTYVKGFSHPYISPSVNNQMVDGSQDVHQS